jgi:hypothetical protein
MSNIKLKYFFVLALFNSLFFISNTNAQNIVSSIPFPLSSPTLYGESKVGSVLSCIPQTFEGGKVEFYTFIFYENYYGDNGEAQSKQSLSNTYKITKKDLGKKISCAVVAYNSKGSSDEMISNEVDIISTATNSSQGNLSQSNSSQGNSSQGNSYSTGTRGTRSSSSSSTSSLITPTISIRKFGCSDTSCDVTMLISNPVPPKAPQLDASLLREYEPSCLAVNSVGCFNPTREVLKTQSLGGGSWVLSFKRSPRFLNQKLQLNLRPVGPAGKKICRSFSYSKVLKKKL